MNCTYDEILKRMNDKFFELSGYEADRVSDIGIRIRLLAGEVFSLTSDIDWLKKQMFPNTASGEQLELHAQQRGLSRIKGSKATGQIIFRLDAPLEYEITVPKGTICTTADGSLNFVTSEAITIIRGASFGMAEAEAEKSGTQYNVPPKSITTVVTYFSVGISIQNSSSFSGGTDDETDGCLRKRIMHSLKNIPNGANREYYISLAKSVDGIQSATIVSDDVAHKLTITLGGRGNQPTETAYRNVQSVLSEQKAVGVAFIVKKAELVNVDVKINVRTKGGYSFDNVIKPKIVSNITEFFNNLSVGETVTLAALSNAVFDIEGIENYNFGDMTDIPISSAQLAKLSSITATQTVST